MCDCSSTCNCDPSFFASATATASATGVYNTVVTASASATATSMDSQQAADDRAQSLATDIAQQNADTFRNNMNQTVDVMKTNITNSLVDFKNLATSSRNITLSGTVAIMKYVQDAAFFVNFIDSAINEFADEIIASGGDYNTVLRPILDKEFGIGSLGYISTRIYYTMDTDTVFDYSKMGWAVNGTEYYNNLNDVYYVDMNQPQYHVPPTAYLQLQILLAKINETFQELRASYPDRDLYYNIWPTLGSTPNGAVVSFRIFRKDVVNPNKWISFYGVTVPLDLVPVPTPISFNNFINRITDEINYIENYPVDNIWQYKNDVYPDLLHCLYSATYPSWTGKLIQDCYIPGSDVDVPNAIFSIIDVLKTKYYLFSLGQIAIVTYSIGENYYTSVCQLIEYEGQIAFSERQISINSYINNPFVINNDTVIHGSLDVRNNNDVSVIKTDNYKNITSFNYKIGVNQEISQVKGLIDVDNLSNASIYDTITAMIDPMLNSYQVTNDIFDSIEYGTTSVTIPPDYINDVCVFKTPVLNKIQHGDIQFLYTPSPDAPFGSEHFAEESFLRIQTIVNEINKLLPNYETFLASDVSPGVYTFSFFELLNDTNHWYLCSLRGLLRQNPVDPFDYEMFFIFSSQGVDTIMTNKSLIRDFTAFMDKSSAANRFLNFCVLIVYQPSVFNGLLNGDSIGSTDPDAPYFSDVINTNPYFFNRLGYPDFTCYSNLFTVLRGQTVSLLYEQYPYFNGNSSTNCYLPNTDICVADIDVQNCSEYSKRFGSSAVNQAFFEYFYWNLGPRLGFINIMPFDGQNYMFGIGVDLVSVLSESIVLKGDNKITGNMSLIDDATNTYIFSVDTVKKNTFSVYNTGIGTQEPASKLDIEDCGLADVISINRALADRMNTINFNLPGLIAAGNTGASVDENEQNMRDYISNNNMIDPVSGEPVFQTPGKYFGISKYNFDTLNALDVTCVYNFIFPNWQGFTMSYLLENDVTNRDAVKKAIDVLQERLNLNEFFSTDNGTNNTFLFTAKSWIYGIKAFSGIVFKLSNGNYYGIMYGVNLQDKLAIETNTNIQNLLGYYSRYTFELQRMNVQLNHISPSDIYNEEKAAVVRGIAANKYPLIRVAKYDINFTTGDILYSLLNYTTLHTVYGPISINNPLMDNLTRSKVLSFKKNLMLSYYQGQSKLLKDNYGITSFESPSADFFSLFYTLDAVGTSAVSILSLEAQTNLIVFPSLFLNGDAQVNGDFYLFDKNLNTNFLFADSTAHFLGVNTLDTNATYANNYSTTSDFSVAKQTVCFHSNTYPNTVIERNQETILVDPYMFANFSTMSSRRQSNLYTFAEIGAHTGEYTTTNPVGVINAFGDGKDNKYGYGTDIAFELKDRSNIVREAGNVGMIMESYDNLTGEMNTGFSVYSNYTNTNTEQLVHKNILYVSNDSNLNVNSVQLGNTNNKLYVDSDGNLRFGDKYLVLSDTPPV